jgi:hypothetical protein
MANNAKVTLTFDIQEDGSVKLVAKNLNDLNKATQANSRATREAGKANDELNYKLKQGVAGASSAGRSFSKLSQAIGEGPNGLVGAYATLAANAFAVSAAFNALKNASQAEAVLKGLEVQGARLGTTLTSTAQEVERLARGQLSLTEAMQATAQASATGFSSESIKELTTVAQNASIALGRNMGDSMDRLIKGTSKLEPELLDELGIMVKLEEATTNYALQTGKTVASLTSFERRQAFLNAVLEEGQTKFGGLSDEVRPDPYVQLGAAFNNLTKETLGFINNTLGVSSIVSFLAENTTALIGVIVMFAGTISRQLVPSLYQMSEATLRSRAAIEAKIATQKKQIDMTLRQAAAERKAAAETMASSKVDTSRSPERVKKYVQALKEGKEVEGQRESAIRSLNGALGGHEKALNRITDKNSEEYRAREQLKEQLEAQKKSLMTLTTAELNHVNLVTTSQEKLASLRKEQRGLRRLDTAQAEQANAIELAGDFEIRRSKEAITKSYGAQRRGLQLVALAQLEAAASGGFLSRTFATLKLQTVGLRAGFFGVAVAARAMGAALLNAIPIIGQILFVGTILVELGTQLWDWMFPPPAGQEALDKAKGALDEILERVDETAKRTSVVFADGGRSAGEAAGAYLALSNTVKEVGDAFKAVEEAQKQLGTDSATKSTELLKTAFETQGQSLGSEVVDSDAFKSLNSLVKLGFEPLNKEILEATVNSKEFQQASDERQVEILGKALGRLTTRYASVGTAVQELRSTFKNLEDATANFIRSATPATPYDGLVDNLTASRTAVLNLEAELAKGTITYEDFVKQVTDLGPKAASLFDATTQQQIKAIQELEVAAKAGRAELEKMGSANFGDYRSKLQEVESIERELVTVRRAGATSVLQALEVEQQRIVALQRQSVIAEGQLKLEQAKFSTIQNSLAATGAGYRVQVEQEEKIRGMQVAKIRAEQAILESLNLQNNIKLESLKYQETELELKIQSLKMSIGELKVLRDQRDALSNLPSGQNLFSEIIEEFKEIGEAEAELKTLTGSIIAAEAEAAKLGNAITAANFSAAAILAENLTEAQKAARALRIDFDNIQKLGDRIRASQSEVLSYEERRLSVVNALSISSLRDLQVSTARFQREKLAADQALKQAEEKLKVSIRDEEANLSRVGATTAEGKAIAVNIALIQRELEITRQTAAVQQEILRANLAIELAERFRIDTLGNGLEIQRDALSLLQREADLKSGLLQQERDITAARLRGLVGTNLNPRTERALEAKALADEYKLAVQQFGLRMAGIDAEYALLEAQRLQLEYNLKAQKVFLEQQARADGIVDLNESRGLDQIRNAIDMIGAVDYRVMKDLAKETERNSLELLKARAMEARGPAGGLFGGLGGAVLQGAAIFDSLNRASKSLEEAKKPADDLAKVVLPDFSKATQDAKNGLNSFEEQLKSLDLNIPELKTRLDQIVETFNEFLDKLKREGSVASEAANMGQIAGSGPQEIAKNLFDYTKRAFPDLRVDEFGVSSGHGEGSMHYDRRAFDVNVQGGGVEANNPANRARLDQVAKDLSSKGVEVLWNGWIWHAGAQVAKIRSEDKHYDHLHAEIDGASYQVIKKLMQTTAAAVSTGAQKAIEDVKPSVVPANDNTGIVVEAERLRHPTLVSRTDRAPTSFDAVETAVEPARLSIGSFLESATPTLEHFIEQFSSLGPQGGVMSAVLSGFMSFGEQLNSTFTVLGMSTEELSKSVGRDLTETGASLVKISSGFSAAAAAIGAINQVVQASSQAKIAGIDREIAAEQRRDGNSAASLAKIESMEKKKDSMARKAFNTNKKLMMAQAVMNTAAAVTGALAMLPNPAAIPLAVLAGVLGAAQIAIIGSTQYDGGTARSASASPSSLSIGRRNDSVNLASGPNASAGGESAFLRGGSGTGTNASNFIGSAYGGNLMRGFGNTGFVVGEKGPEVITPETPINVTPANENSASSPVNATINIQAIDSQGVQDVLVSQKGNIIQMLRQAANANGQRFLEDVNVNVYTRPSVGKLL